MIVSKPLPFVTQYVEKLSDGLEQKHPTGKPLTWGQKQWLTFCIMSIFVTESVCWQKFVQIGLGRFSEALLSYYFRVPMT